MLKLQTELLVLKHNITCQSFLGNKLVFERFYDLFISTTLNLNIKS